MQDANLDLALLDDGYGTPEDTSGAFPQRFRDADFSDGYQQPPGSEDNPVWQMGGTDGPLGRVDYKTGNVNYTMGVYGRLASEDAESYVLGTGYVKRTIVVRSSDAGDTWQEIASLPFNDWRTDVVALPDGRMAFMRRASKACAESPNRCHEIFITGDGANIGEYQGTEHGVSWWHARQKPWDEGLTKEGRIVFVQGESSRLRSNVATEHLLFRSPNSSGFLLSVPEMIPTIDENQEGTESFGYRLYYYGYPQKTVAELAPNEPRSANNKSFILHPTVVDPGDGPVMLYWYDVDVAAGEMSIRGRIIATDYAYTPEFPISQPFDLPKDNSWYGDYITAGGYRAASRVTASSTHNKRVPVDQEPASVFFPVWEQPDGKAHYARVEYTPPAKSSDHTRVFEAVEITAPPPPVPGAGRLPGLRPY